MFRRGDIRSSLAVLAHHICGNVLCTVTRSWSAILPHTTPTPSSRERERETDRQRDRQTDRQTERERERERETDGHHHHYSQSALQCPTYVRLPMFSSTARRILALLSPTSLWLAHVVSIHSLTHSDGCCVWCAAPCRQAPMGMGTGLSFNRRRSRRDDLKPASRSRVEKSR